VSNVTVDCFTSCMMSQVSQDVVSVSCWSYTGSIQQQHLQSSIQKYQAQQQVCSVTCIYLYDMQLDVAVSVPDITATVKGLPGTVHSIHLGHSLSHLGHAIVLPGTVVMSPRTACSN